MECDELRPTSSQTCLRSADCRVPRRNRASRFGGGGHARRCHHRPLRVDDGPAGVNVYVEENGEAANQWQADATNEMKGIKSLDANAVAIAFPFYTPSLDANCVYAYTANDCDESTRTPTRSRRSPARMSVLVKTAQQPVCTSSSDP